MKQTKRVLSVVLALAMVLAMNIMVFAAGQTTAKMDLKGVVEGDTVTVTVNGSGDFSKFDFGVSFDSSKVTVDSIKINSDFRDVMLGDGGNGSVTSSNQDTNAESQVKGYVVIGGTSEEESAKSYNGPVATIVFKGTDVSSIKGFVDSGDVYEAAVAAGTTDMSKYVAENPSVVGEVKDVVADTPATEVPGTETPGTETPATQPADNNQPTQPADNNQPTQPADNNQTPGQQNPGQQNPGTTKTQAPAGTTAPVKGTGTTPKTADTANVVLPVVAIVAAAAAVVVVSKKRVEE